MRRRLFIFAALLVSLSRFLGQELQVHNLESVPIGKSWYSKLNYSNFNEKCKALRLDLIQEGYLACSIDSLVKNDSLKQADAYFYLGEKFDFSKIVFDSDVIAALKEVRGEEYYVRQLENSPAQLVKVIEELLDYYENHGYPFVGVRLKDPVWNESHLESQLTVTKGRKITIEDVIIKSDDKINPVLLQNIINIRKGDLYSEQRINAIEKKIKEVSYLQSMGATQYEIVNNHCHVYIYVKYKNSNSFNAILGILPSDNGKINITGDARIKLLNSFRNGELLDFNWRKLLPLTQNLNIHVNYPYLFNSDFGIDARFDLYKKDTSFLDLNSVLGIQYQINNRMGVKIFYHNKSSSLLSTEKYQYATVLPNFADVFINNYGAGWYFNNLDYKYNPSKGWAINMEGSVGDKRIRKNTALDDALYMDLKLRTTQFKFTGIVEKYINLRKRNVLMIGLDGGWIFNESIFENELFRLGGLRTIRGFDEESLFASSYGIGTLEYRFLLEENSNLFAFVQGMYYDKTIPAAHVSDVPYSFGLGINFQTAPGIFSLSYSLGSQSGNPILFKTAKIHFGFVNYF